MDLGGFRGRTNKLVDGCYSWWVGGCFALLDGLDGGAEFADSAPIVEPFPDDAMDIDWDNIEGGHSTSVYGWRLIPACR